ncbi:hypothetical protein V6N12_025039 [Hibiscus sabdariffa]|uniref:Uncharacterized protein n=1 Tax=Hibiscus sabdariffa TaxID=183260 RepID=A0ABR2BMW8_9ROSI
MDEQRFEQGVTDGSQGVRVLRRERDLLAHTVDPVVMVCSGSNGSKLGTPGVTDGQDSNSKKDGMGNNAKTVELAVRRNHDPTSGGGLKVQIGVKGVGKGDTKPHKRDDQGKSKTTLADRLSSLTSDLDRVAVVEEHRLVQE